MPRYTPLSKPPYSKDTVSKYFGPKANGNFAQELHKTPSLYQDMRDSAVYYGFVSELTGYANAREIAALPCNAPANTFTDHELRCMSEFDLATCQRYYKRSGDEGSTDNLSEVYKNDSAKADRLRTAAVCHNLVPARAAKPAAPAPEPKAPATFALGEPLRQYFGLPAGYQVETKEFLRLSNLKSQFEAERAEKEQAVVSETV